MVSISKRVHDVLSLSKQASKQGIKIIPHVVRSMQRRIWIDYDEDADVLYINFTYPPKAVEHEEDESGIVKKIKFI